MAISVTYNEMDGWPKEMATLEGFAAERKLKCAWGDRTKLMVEIMSYGNNVYPYNDSLATVTHIPRCEGLRKGKMSVGAQSHMASYVYAVVTVNYSTYGLATGYHPVSHLLITESLDTSFEFSTLDRTDLQWADETALKPNEAPGKIEPIMDYMLMYHAASFIPASVLSLPGKVNSNAVSTYLLGISFPVETVLYMGARAKHRLTTTGLTAIQLAHQFKYKASGWNKAYRIKTKSYEDVFDKAGNPVKKYESGSFNF